MCGEGEEVLGEAGTAVLERRLRMGRGACIQGSGFFV